MRAFLSVFEINFYIDKTFLCFCLIRAVKRTGLVLVWEPFSRDFFFFFF